MNTGAANGGGDTDVEVADDHSVYVADLEAVGTDICTSHDFGKTYLDCAATAWRPTSRGPRTTASG